METIYKLIISDSETFAWAGGLVVGAFIIYRSLVWQKFKSINKDIKLILEKCNSKAIHSKDDILNLADCSHPALKDSLKETAKRFIVIGPDKKPSFISSPDDLWYFKSIFFQEILITHWQRPHPIFLLDSDCY